MVTTARGERGQPLMLAATLGLAAALFGLGVWSVGEALEERSVATEATDLRLASLAVASADALQRSGQSLPVADLSATLTELRADHDRALHSLAPPERQRAETLLDQMAPTATRLLDKGERPPVGRQVLSPLEQADYRQIDQLLGLAAGRAVGRAGVAERREAILFALMAVTLTMATWYASHLRGRRAERLAVQKTELHAGRRLERLLNDTPDIFLVINPAGLITYRSASAGRLLPPGSTRAEDLVARVVSDTDRTTLARHLTLPGAESSARSFELLDPAGLEGWFEIRVSDLTSEPLVDGHLITARDITNEIHLRQDLTRQANTDMLTGLPNRRALDRVLTEASTRATHSGGSVALLSLDLDGFKDVNDTLGHHVGDELLTRVAERLSQATRSGDVLLRLGGDEFAVLLPSLTGPDQAERAAERYLAVLDEPVRLGPRLEQLRTSVGVAVTDDPAHVRSLVVEADIAMYAAKRAGGSRIAVFDAALEGATLSSSLINRALRTIDFDRELSVVYQPIVTVDGLRMVGLEALLRWTSPTLGPVPPDEFIPVAERSGDIGAIGDWVLRTVCRQIRRWEADGLGPEITVSFNVSALQLADDGFVARVLATADTFGVATGRLVAEVTESSVLDNTGIAVQRLAALRAAGIRISIDDFGSGYSNLSQLLRVPFDIIKIDRSLLVTLSQMREASGGDPAAPCSIMEAIVSIAGTLNAPVVCEGVETDEQRRSLEMSGITLVQGYLTGRPTRPEDLALPVGSPAQPAPMSTW